MHKQRQSAKLPLSKVAEAYHSMCEPKSALRGARVVKVVGPNGRQCNLGSPRPWAPLGRKQVGSQQAVRLRINCTRRSAVLGTCLALPGHFQGTCLEVP
jgi:hypothetical protein